MPYVETKVYFDGSHYIAIPHTERPNRKRRKPKEELITVRKKGTEVKDEKQAETQEKGAESQRESAPEKAVVEVNIDEERTLLNYAEIDKRVADIAERKQNERKITKKELFNELYAESMSLPRRERKEKITEGLRPYFKTEQALTYFVDNNFERKRRNLIARRIRMTRKANLQNFNYFVTFTYDGKLHTETSFKKKLTNSLSHFSSRQKWKYIGVWERSPEKKRLHFHGIFDIPNGTMPGLLFEKEDYNFNTHKRQVTVQNSYFNEKFGRSDFERIEERHRLGDALAYLMKYLEKTGEKIVYSRGLPQFFISDILDEDIVTKFDESDENSKLLLYDDFTCWDMGVKVGVVSPDTIAEMRKCN